MIEFDNGGRLVTSVDELPDLRNAKTLYLDTETTSGDTKLDSLDVWHNCGLAGIAATIDDAQGAWYIPVGHSNPADNLPQDAVFNWLADVIGTAGRWTNHNVKYDMHTIANNTGIVPTCPVFCTVIQAKIVDSDRQLKGGYGLDALSRAWLREDIEKYEKAFAPYLYRKKDYGRIPADLLGEYTCQDVLTNRRLEGYILANTPEECADVVRIETDLTTILFDMERVGMRVDPVLLQTQELLLYHRLLAIEEQLTRLTGRTFRPHVNEDCFDVLCNQYGLPILAWTQGEDDEPSGNPSFDKDALKLYLVHPAAPKGVVKLIAEYRHINTLINFFIKRYLIEHIDGIMHPSYNQAVRTGRMSCKKPNAQQLSPEAKALILPHEGYTFVSVDYSQIEFRIIVHYIQDPNAIAAYQADPDTDFHQWVADTNQVPRKPAKTLNFMMGYGGGRKRCVKSLATNESVMEQIQAKLEEMVAGGRLQREQMTAAFNVACQQRAETMYERYHSNLPTLKRTARRASQALEQRGYVYNWHGRRRHLPRDKAFKAFNSLCQSEAADIMKERLVAAWRQYRSDDVLFVANVHDEMLLAVRSDRLDVDFIDQLVATMETVDKPLRVPIRCAVGWSALNWLDASKVASAWTPTRKTTGI